MDKQEVIKMLREAICDDPYCCPFGMCSSNEKHDTICTSTNPPFIFYKRSEYSCPFLLNVADMLEEQEAKQ